MFDFKRYKQEINIEKACLYSLILIFFLGFFIHVILMKNPENMQIQEEIRYQNSLSSSCYYDKRFFPSRSLILEKTCLSSIEKILNLDLPNWILFVVIPEITLILSFCLKRKNKKIIHKVSFVRVILQQSICHLIYLFCCFLVFPKIGCTYLRNWISLIQLGIVYLYLPPIIPYLIYLYIYFNTGYVLNNYLEYHQ